ncbi:hypothetical protein, partial [Mesorhizobium marinum]|uniref:hypothetical protein n=1 Tax=Mesorhizobium marinum TaxID=3228790 RepID=UPI003465AC62
QGRREYRSRREGVDKKAGTIEGYEGRGVWVPEGLSARDIMEGAKVLERDYDVAPYTARDMVRTVLIALEEAKHSAIS